jgi:hypothetical protein
MVNAGTFRAPVRTSVIKFNDDLAAFELGALSHH